MKKIFLFSLIGLALCFTSCKKVGSIGGTVSLDDEGVQGATVTLYFADGETALKTVTTDADGYYEFADLEAELSYDIDATYEDEDGFTYSATQTASLSKDEDKIVDLDLIEDEE